jgi:2-polyprenyl-6-methoxyphenol hydroxylase-like FAD-dependent oxidoreductase
VYDAIVVGARLAGAATAMLLARKGMRVLAVDRASFPSDTLSTHQLQVPGAARLARWGVWDKVLASGVPAATRIRFDQPGVALAGNAAGADGIEGVYSPRRTILDAVLVDAARAAGAEVREGFVVQDLVRVDGRVAGIRGTGKGGATVTERARVVVGADGKNSFVARTVGARAYRERPVRTVGCYSYWSGVPLDGGEIYGRPGRAFGAWPTNDGLTLLYVAWPVAEFPAFRADVEGSVLATVDLVPEFAARLRAGQRVERFRSSPDLPNRFRQPYGPGWALAGDAGLVMDPLTAQGMGHALRDAELLSEAVAAGTGRALAAYHRERDRQARPMYDLTVDLARLAAPPAVATVLFAALADNPVECDRFFAMLGGTVPVREFFNPVRLGRLVGWRKLLPALLARRPAQATTAG